MSSSNSNGGIGFIGLLQVVFITLKIMNKVDWSWFWVLSPAIFSSVVAIILIIVAYIFFD